MPRSSARVIGQPPKPTSLECEPLLRVFLGDLGSVEQMRTAVAQVRADGHAILDVGRVVGREYLEGRAPFQDQLPVRAFVLDFLSHHARVLIDWADRTDAALDEWGPEGGADEARIDLAREIVRRNLASYPPPASVAPDRTGRDVVR